MTFMYKFSFAIFVLALGTSFPTSSNATPIHSGETLLQLCENQADKGFEIACDGYIAGVFDTWRESSSAAAIIVRKSNPSADFAKTSGTFAGFCIKTRTSIRQLTAIVTAYLKANPKEWQEPASFLIRQALTDAFPCQK